MKFWGFYEKHEITNFLHISAYSIPRNLDLGLQKCMFCAKGLPLRPETTLFMKKLFFYVKVLKYAEIAKIAKMWAPSRRMLPGLVKPMESHWFGGPQIPQNRGN